MSMFVPVSTIEDLAGLDDDAIVEGYREGLRASPDEPEPGPNRGRAFWHGWCNAMRDRCIFPPTPASKSLAREYLATRH